MSDVKQETVIAPAYMLGAADERARIVAWLRKASEGIEDGAIQYWAKVIAAEIERGAHE